MFELHACPSCYQQESELISTGAIVAGTYSYWLTADPGECLQTTVIRHDVSGAATVNHKMLVSYQATSLYVMLVGHLITIATGLAISKPCCFTCMYTQQAS